MRCNCSICKRLGIIRSPALKPQQLKLLTGQDSLTAYLFGDQVVQHQFCGHCGVNVFYTGEQCKVNLGCVDEIDLKTIDVENYDGANLL